MMTIKQLRQALDALGMPDDTEVTVAWNHKEGEAAGFTDLEAVSKRLLNEDGEVADPEELGAEAVVLHGHFPRHEEEG